MQTIRRAAAVLMCPAMLCLSVACERAADRTPTSPPAARPRGDLLGATTQDATEWLARALSLGVVLSDDPTATPWTDEPEDDPPDNDPIHVDPFQFDPGKTDLVRARWLRGTGCPTNATTFDGSTSKSFSDPACNDQAGGGDPKDRKNAGLLLVKTGPTTNDAAAGAEVKGVKGITLAELGYDIRKPATLAADPNDPRGSHCGAGAPRFNVATTAGFFFVGCNSPPATTATGGPAGAWQRLRWGKPPLVCVLGFRSPGPGVAECITGTVQSIAIVFDEGDDTGPDNFGLAVLDNIDVNGQLVGRGPGN